MNTKPVIDLTAESNLVSQVQVQIPKEETDIRYSIDFIKNPIDDNEELCYRYLLVMKDIESKMIHYSLIERFDLDEIIHQIAGLFVYSHISSMLYVVPPHKTSGLIVDGPKVCLYFEDYNIPYKVTHLNNCEWFETTPLDSRYYNEMLQANRIPTYYKDS